ncbi:RidA family protein [Acidovorax sp. Leaf160]|uniref:RidA family protein n=1 Tax=Acidovorax sp. Leaf160 TaxID=1736280 RepID=UPI00070087ED|nr:RidA family protein [Acidovorax sp. Leaf160]KQR55265.1 hypothetical protein ASF94_02035 [Acidovorax sp. Leaf160]
MPSSSARSSTSSAPLPRFHNPAGLYDPQRFGYSHLAVVPQPARVVHIAGQGGEDADGRLPAGFDAQMRQALGNLRLALAAAGASPADVARLTVLVVEHSEARLAVFSRALMAMWGDAPTPACTLIPVPRLAIDGMLFEIDATAYLRADDALPSGSARLPSPGIASQATA